MMKRRKSMTDMTTEERAHYDARAFLETTDPPFRGVSKAWCSVADKGTDTA